MTSKDKTNLSKNNVVMERNLLFDVSRCHVVAVDVYPRNMNDVVLAKHKAS